MKCIGCGKEITFDNARHCIACGHDYCDECADELAMCDCCEELGFYS